MCMGIAPLRLLDFISRHRNDRVLANAFVDDNDVPAVGRVPEQARAAAGSTEPGGFVILKHVIDIIGGEIVIFNVPNVTAIRVVPDDVRPAHRASLPTPS